MKRNNCIVCNHDKLTEHVKIDNFPVYMGATNLEESECFFEDLSYGICENCQELQILNLIPLEILYQENHNTEVVGGIWEEHNKKFAEFISFEKPKNVFEIGSPSATIFKKLQNEDWLEKWVTIEPNPIEISDVNFKYSTILGFLDENLDLKSFGYHEFDSVVLSHVFEHFYEPKKMLKIISNLVKNEGSVYISIPNMKHISNNNLMPPSGMHFEHSYYIDDDNIEFFLNGTNFVLKEIYYYANHSIFIKLGKVKEIKKEKNIFDNSEKLLRIDNLSRTVQFYKEKISEIKLSLLDFSGDVYIYGSHFPAQYLYFNGLKDCTLVGCLDQSKTKIGKTLYGTNLKVYHPETLRNKKNICVIVHMGPYTSEIKDMLSKINNKIKFL